ncbi:hypothetical protein KJ966_25640 [bacterium]|nr:hypothetical protein [bacterium]
MKLLNISGYPVPLDQLSQYSNLAIYPGSFNPLHEGHRGIFDLLNRNGYHVICELSKTRYQKPPYPEEKVKELTSQFIGFSELLVSDAPLFQNKRDQLSQFKPFWVMGFDTAKRWIDENKHVDQAEKNKIKEMKVLFIGRLINGEYYDPHSLLDGSEPYEHKIFPYHCDVSSTQIRSKLDRL